MDEKLITPIVGLAGVVVGGLLTMTKDYALARRKEKRDAVYLAIRVVPKLEHAAQCCQDLLDSYSGTRKTPRYQDFSLPAMELEKLDVQWTSIPSATAMGLLSLDGRMRAASSELDRIAECPDDQLRELRVQRQHWDLGSTLARWARVLRRLAKMNKQAPHFQYGFDKHDERLRRLSAERASQAGQPGVDVSADGPGASGPAADCFVSGRYQPR